VGDEYPEWLRKAKRRAREFIDRLPPPKYGAPLNLEDILSEDEELSTVESIDDMPPEAKKAYLSLSLHEVKSSAVAIQVDARAWYEEYVKSIIPKGVEIMNTDEAVRRYDWLKDYWFKAFPMTLNRLTAIHAAYSRGGAFIHVAEGVKVRDPIQSCFIVASSRYAQLPHSIVIAEPNSEIHIISGCTAPSMVGGSLHAGLTEVYVKRGAKVVSTMIEMWSRETHSRPLKAVIVEDGGEYIENFVVLDPGKSIQAYPTVILRGVSSSTVMRTISIGSRDADVDIGEAAYLFGKGSRARLINRAVAMDTSVVRQRTKAWSKASGTSAFLECSGVIIGDKAIIETYPTLKADVKDTELYHESAVGKFSKNQLIYLMSKGFSEDEAVALLIRGFLDPKILNLPKPIEIQVSRIVDLIIKRGIG